MRARWLQGLVGEATVRRPVYHCAACRAMSAPLDAAWGLGGGALTPALAKVVARDGIEAAFGQGAELVWAHLGVRVGEEVARLATEAAGAVAEADFARSSPVSSSARALTRADTSAACASVIGAPGSSRRSTAPSRLRRSPTTAAARSMRVSTATTRCSSCICCSAIRAMASPRSLICTRVPPPRPDPRAAPSATIASSWKASQRTRKHSRR